MRITFDCNYDKNVANLFYFTVDEAREEMTKLFDEIVERKEKTEGPSQPITAVNYINSIFFH